VNSNCPSQSELERLLANQLSQAQEQALEEHLAGCLACRQRLDELTCLPQPVAGPPPACRASERELPRGGVLARLSGSAQGVRASAQSGAEQKSRSDTSLRRISTSSLSASGRFLRRQIWTWPLLAALVLGVLGWWVIGSVEDAMREQRISELATVLNADVAALRLWIDNKRATTQLVAADETLRPLVAELLALAGDSPQDPQALIRSPAQLAIRSRLTEPLRRGGFSGFTIISPAGVMLALENDNTPVGAKVTGYRREFFTSAAGGQAGVSKPFRSPLLLADEHGELRADQPCMYAAAPIRDADGRPLAALGLRIRPDDQFTRILKVARPGQSGETYAFDRDGLLLSQSRFDEQLKQIGLLVDQPQMRSILNVELRDPGVNMAAGERPAKRRADQPLTRMARAAVQGHDGHDVEGYRDYRGVPVVGAWQWLDEYDIGVATEVDVHEAFAPAYILRRALATLMGLLVAGALGVYIATLLIARQRRQLQKAAAATQRFGQYTLAERLGGGGMGTVYRASHALLRRPTAVKLLNPDAISNSAIARFEREVQLTSALTHPNTVAIYDYGRTPEGVFYYAMEFLEGVNLDELVRRYGPLPEARILFILRQVCASLAEAHAAGLVHRDIKPPNIFLTMRGGQYDFVKVLDFGLAKLTSDDSKLQLTATHTIAGSPLYVSPEGVTQPATIDSRADVYGLGAVIYFLLTGTPVFSGETATQICLMHVRELPEPPSSRVHKPVTPVLEELVLRCLEKSPADRPRDANELLELLENCQVAGSWTAVEAARWWGDREHEHSAATQIAIPQSTLSVSSSGLREPRGDSQSEDGMSGRTSAKVGRPAPK
jgi:serine/threonine protein kinase